MRYLLLYLTVFLLARFILFSMCILRVDIVLPTHNH